MKIVDYSTLPPVNQRASATGIEALTAALLFLVPVLLLFVLAS